MLIVGVILVELLAAYVFWYRSIEVKEAQIANDSVVRVDLPGYRKVILFLDRLETYIPDNDADVVGSPFIYR